MKNTIKIKGYWDFFEKYVSAKRKPPYFYDPMVIKEEDGTLTPSLSFDPSEELQNICGFKKQPNDPYDDFDDYIQYEIVLEKDKVRLYCGDNFDTKVFDFKGNTSSFKRMLKGLLS